MHLMRFVMAAAVAAGAASAGIAGAGQGAAAEVAAQMTGTWTVNRELSPGFREDGGAGSRGRRGGGPALQIAAQRGGGRGGGGGGEGGADRPNVTTTEAAAQAALQTISQLPVEFTLAASVSELRLIEPRGSSQFRIDNKTTAVEVPGGSLKVKSRWDRSTLRQEFASVQRVLKRSWSLDAGGRLVIRQKIESLDFNSKEVEAVYDKQPAGR